MGTALYRVKKAADLFVIVVTLLAHGCPPQAIVAAFGLDERTVKAWFQRAGQHCQQVHEHQDRDDLTWNKCASR
jgi:transposase-like protein